MKNFYFLAIVGKIAFRLRRLYDDKLVIESALEKVTGSADIISCGKGAKFFDDRMAKLIGKKRDIELKIQDFLFIYLKCKFDLKNILSLYIDSERVQNVLFRRYGLLEKFNLIATDLKISIRQVYRLHQKGINQLKSVEKLF